MILIRTPDEMREWSRAERARGRTVGFVPTMGSLHAGHLSLVQRARGEHAAVAASVFVNPAQFGPAEDFDRYPRDIERDGALLREAGVQALFHPDAPAMYPGGVAAFRTWITVEGLSDVLEGAARPGHFRGVATVVAKLLNVVEPDGAYFGQKDAQQALVIRTLARDLDMGVRIVVCPTVREPDGLAMSSRNAYLTPAQRAAAPVIFGALSRAAEAAASGERSPRAILAQARRVLDSEPLFRTEYVELVSTADLRPIEEAESGKEALLAVAGRLGGTRLIDNAVIPAA
ncbi:MAG: pantoate--beta-alanine ligase [Candidatus Polarisedimenticolia bacterium]